MYFQMQEVLLWKLDLANRNKWIQQLDIFSSAMHYNHSKEDINLKIL